VKAYTNNNIILIYSNQYRLLPGLLTLCVFEGFFGKLFVLFFVCGKTPATGVFPQEHTTHFLHEALWGKGFKVNSLALASLLW
jgi:hypothetical protein